MNQLLFLANELSNPIKQRNMRIPCEFIQFGHIDGKLYTHAQNKGVFVLQDDPTRIWGNSKVYGALFMIRDFDFYNRILDAYHMCSMTTLFTNHKRDIHHRVYVDFTPIYFNTLDELSRLKYREGESVQVQTYLGNLHHPKIHKRLRKDRLSYRILDGIDVESFKQLYREVSND